MKSNKKLIISLLTLITIFTLSSCYTPSPLYGTWNDNLGNKITFISDGTFMAKILDSNKITVSYEGEYTIIDNALIFNTSSGDIINTEWDLRGSMLYLTWTTKDKQIISLTLYHTAK